MSRTFDEIVLDGLRARVAELENENAVLAAQNANFRTVLAAYAKDYDTDEFGMATMALEMPAARVVAVYWAAIKLADQIWNEDIDMSPKLFEAYEEYVVAREGL